MVAACSHCRSVSNNNTHAGAVYRCRRPRHNERALSHKERENTEMIQRFSREYAIFKELLTVVETLRNAPGRERTVSFCGYQGLLQGGGTRAVFRG